MPGAHPGAWPSPRWLGRRSSFRRSGRTLYTRRGSRGSGSISRSLSSSTSPRAWRRGFYCGRSWSRCVEDADQRACGVIINVSSHRCDPGNPLLERNSSQNARRTEGSLPGFHLRLQPTLGECGTGTGSPRSTLSTAARRELPVGSTLSLGRESSNCPRYAGDVPRHRGKSPGCRRAMPSPRFGSRRISKGRQNPLSKPALRSPSRASSGDVSALFRRDPHDRKTLLLILGRELSQGTSGS